MLQDNRDSVSSICEDRKDLKLRTESCLRKLIFGRPYGMNRYNLLLNIAHAVGSTHSMFIHKYDNGSIQFGHQFESDLMNFDSIDEMIDELRLLRICVSKSDIDGCYLMSFLPKKAEVCSHYDNFDHTKLFKTLSTIYVSKAGTKMFTMPQWFINSVTNFPPPSGYHSIPPFTFVETKHNKKRRME
jgi:hypothetical protein